MARIRTVKPAHWLDRELPKISLQAHLLWIATWNFSDDEGVFEDDPLLLKSQIFPRRTDIRVEQVKQWLDQLVKARFIIPFSYNGEGYYISRTFKTHQKIDRPQPSSIPEDVLTRVFAEYSSNDRRTFDASRVEDSMGEDEGATGEDSPPPPQPTPEEMEFNDVLKWMEANCARVLKMKEPLRIDQYFKLKEKYGPEMVSQMLLSMHNWKKLFERESAYLTFLTFIKRELKNQDQ